MENLSFDAIVIGAGASGLLASLEIALTGRKVAVLEAKERIGGRILTVVDNGLPFELGAEFVHGNLSITKEILNKAGVKIEKIKGSVWRHKTGKLKEEDGLMETPNVLEKAFQSLDADKPVDQFLEEELAGENWEELRQQLRNYVQGYYAADPKQSSTIALRDELTAGEEEQYRPRGGYRLLLHYLEEQCRKKGVSFFLSEPVKKIRWQKGSSEVITERAAYQCSKVLVTVSVGVLQAEKISFQPALPQITAAANRLGFGHVIKLVFQFENAFWKNKSLTEDLDLSDLYFLFSEEFVPTWWSHYPTQDNILVGWLAGPRAQALQNMTANELKEQALASLGRIFNLNVVHLYQLVTAMKHYNWNSDEYVCGAYSYEVVGGREAIRELQQPVENTVFFAGEGLHSGPEIGTVEAALASGRETGQKLIASFSTENL